jgi:hypothetical protein
LRGEGCLIFLGSGIASPIPSNSAMSYLKIVLCYGVEWGEPSASHNSLEPGCLTIRTITEDGAVCNLSSGHFMVPLFGF